MSLDGALSIASSGLAHVNRQLALVSQNVANAGTPDYAAEYSTQRSISVGATGYGVFTGPAARRVDAALQEEVFRQGSNVTGLTTTQTALRAIDAVLGTPGQGSDLASLLGKLTDQFGALLNDPANPTQQSRVAAGAATLASGINTLSQAYTKQRQVAHDDIIAAVGSLNRALDTIGLLSNRIIALKSGGQSTADLESQRDAALHTVSELVSVKALVQANGEMLVVTTGGLSLPTRGAANAFTLADAGLQPATWYPGGGVPGIMLNGQDVTGQLRGGRIGADIALRDVTLPTFQAELDEFAHNLASRFDAQGLTLFTDPTGAVPVSSGPPVQSGYVGFAAVIQVNPAVAATPSLLRDGTHAVPGSPTGASAFTPNAAGGPAGFSAMLRRVLDFALGTEAQTGVTQPAPSVSGLGPAGSLSAPFAPPASPRDFATALVGAQSRESADTSERLETRQALRDSLANRLAAGSGVNMDAEMTTMLTLQTAYSANARVLSVLQSLFNDLMNTVR